jgi:hypothetical protein
LFATEQNRDSPYPPACQKTRSIPGSLLPQWRILALTPASPKAKNKGIAPLEIFMTALHHETPLLCWICGHPAKLETCKIDEYGLPVHESCQALKLSLHNEASRKPGSFTDDPVRRKAS